MSIDKTYRCDLCRDIHDPDDGLLIGIHWDGKQWHETTCRDHDRHICAACVSSFQALETRCGDGVRGCRGGPRCSSDHK